MATHFFDYASIEGRVTACGRFFDACKPLPRGVAITTDCAAVSCSPALERINSRSREPEDRERWMIRAFGRLPQVSVNHDVGTKETEVAVGRFFDKKGARNVGQVR